MRTCDFSGICVTRDVDGVRVDGVDVDGVRPARLVAAVLLCLCLSALLASEKLLKIAEREPLGVARDRLIVAAEINARVANLFWLNRPYTFLRSFTSSDADNPGTKIDTIPSVPSMSETLFNKNLNSQNPRSSLFNSNLLEEDIASEAGSGLGIAGEAEQPDVITTTTLVDETLAEQQPLVDETLTAQHREISTAQPYREVSYENPLNVYLAGDSQAYYLGLSLRQGEFREILDVDVDNRHSTGLARPDYFNWPAYLVDKVSSNTPDLIILSLGSNDWQAVSSKGQRHAAGTAGWQAEWAWRLAVTFELLADTADHVMWLGLPPSSEKTFQTGFKMMNQIAADVVSEFSYVTMIDIWDVFGGDNPYRASLIPPEDLISPEDMSDKPVKVKPVKVRQSDGVHLNLEGAKWVADIVRKVIGHHWDVRSGKLGTDMQSETGG